MKTIDTRNSGGTLVILGDAVAIPTSNSTSFPSSSPRVAGSIRYNPDNNTLEYLSNTSLDWMSLSGVDTAGFVSIGALNQYLPLAGGTMEGPLIVFTSGSSSAGSISGGDGLMTISSTGGLRVSSGTTGQRPSANTGGIVRWNSTLSDLEFSTGSAWKPILQTISDVANATVNALVVAETILANSAVTEIKIANYAVTEFKLANASVTERALAANSVTQTIIAPGAVTASAYSNSSIANSKLAPVATQTIKGRTTSGTGAVEDLTTTQVTAMLANVVGDSGSGGTKGLVPAPAAGDAAANKFLAASGLWAAINTGTFSGTATAWEGSVGPYKLKGGRYAGGSINPTITFQTAFSDTCLWVGVTPRGTGANTNQLNHSVRLVQLNGDPTTTNFSAWCSWEEEVSDVFIGSVSVPFDWIAIGI